MYKEDRNCKKNKSSKVMVSQLDNMRIKDDGIVRIIKDGLGSSSFAPKGHLRSCALRLRQYGYQWWGNR